MVFVKSKGTDTAVQAVCLEFWLIGLSDQVRDGVAWIRSNRHGASWLLYNQEEPPRSATGEDRRKFLKHDDCEYRFLVVSGCGIQSLPEWVNGDLVRVVSRLPCSRCEATPTLFQSIDYIRQRDARVIQENRVNDWLATLTFCLLRLLQGRSIELCMAGEIDRAMHECCT